MSCMWCDCDPACYIDKRTTSVFHFLLFLCPAFGEDSSAEHSSDGHLHNVTPPEPVIPCRKLVDM